VRFWISFYVRDPDPNSDTWPSWPGKWWISGSTCELVSRLTVCGVLDADDETSVVAAARVALGADAELRFCDAKPSDWMPNADRFAP
jgi:hypothetical protein